MVMAYLFHTDKQNGVGHCSNYQPPANWKVLIVDDEPDVHQDSKLVLDGFEFQGAGLELLFAYSYENAKQVLSEHRNVSIALIDMVMESKDAGIQLAKYIRDDQNNAQIQLALRIEQASEKPQQSIITNYAISDCIDKSQCASGNLKQLISTLLSRYQNLTL